MKQKMTTCILQTYIQHSTRQAAKQLWNLSGSSTTVISESRENKGIFLLISLVWIYWVALDETYFSEDFSFWRLRCIETDVCIQVI